MPFFNYPSDIAREDLSGRPLASTWQCLRHTLRHRIEAEAKFLKLKSRLGMRLINHEAIRPLGPLDVPLIVPVRNDRSYLASFLRHYRGLGVTRFIIVDDLSDDGTAERLSGEADVDLWQSDLRYRDAMRSRAWRDFLVRTYGVGRWYLNLDIDEYLVYPGSDTGRPIWDFIAALKRHRILHCPAPMIDAYRPGPLSDAVMQDGDARMPWEIATHLDGADYSLEIGNSALNLKGGVRTKAFRSRVDLMKYPLKYWDRWTSYGSSIHRPLPFWRNFSPICGVLLHFKLFADLGTKAKVAVADNQYYDGAREYRRLAEVDDIERVRLDFATGIPFAGSEDLVKRGFMVALD